MWALVSRNKRVVSLDPDTERGREVLRGLVEAADVVIENLPRSTLERWGCTFEEIAQCNPRAVVVSVSCYGATGPYAGRDGNGSLAEAFGGLTHMTGDPSGPPMLPSIALGDTLTAIAGTVGALVACYHRDVAGGGGQHVDVSMYEPVLQLLAGTVIAADPDGPVPGRTGSRVPGGAPRNVYRTRDGHWVVVSGTTDNQVARFLPILGIDTTAGRQRFGRSAARLTHADELDELVGQWVGERERAEVMQTLLEARIPVAPVNSVVDLRSDPHVVARDDLIQVDGPDAALTMVAPTPRLSATPGVIRWAGPPLGAHNHEVYRDWLGLPPDEVDELHAAGVI
jgi:crotonobetainyl-CoA:carnitine CoA-transferase CaiB-like acyl-CoA transferase